MKTGKTIAVEFPSDVIATGPWIQEPGYIDRRIVLRLQARNYVVHTQGCEDEVMSYSSGHYFPRTPNTDAAELSRAFACFVHRCGQLLDTDAADVARTLSASVISAQLVERGLITLNGT